MNEVNIMLQKNINIGRPLNLIKTTVSFCEMRLKLQLTPYPWLYCNL